MYVRAVTWKKSKFHITLCGGGERGQSVLSTLSQNVDNFERSLKTSINTH